MPPSAIEVRRVADCNRRRAMAGFHARVVSLGDFPGVRADYNR